MTPQSKRTASEMEPPGAQLPAVRAGGLGLRHVRVVPVRARDDTQRSASIGAILLLQVCIMQPDRQISAMRNSGAEHRMDNLVAAA